MGYNSFFYLGMFLPVLLLVYQVSPVKLRKYELLLSSWVYFALLCKAKSLFVYIVVTTVFVYLAGIFIDKASEKSQKKLRTILCACFVACLFGVLLYTKYTNFFASSIFSLTQGNHPDAVFTPLNILAPIGISYYTLEAVSYLMEVYWGRTAADKSFVRLGLFLGFFPQIMEGPIARYQDTVEQFDHLENLTADNLVYGSVRSAWGLFKKMVIADRLAMVVSYMYLAYDEHFGINVLLMGVFYAVQLYLEFSGIMDIIMGTAAMFGIRLPENFRQPFFSQSAGEFWQRWHITLGVWLKTYVFYPISVSGLSLKLSKKLRKKYGKHAAKIGVSAISLLPVWLFNGLWHGPQWNYILYGIYYFVLLMIDVCLEQVKANFYKKTGYNKKGKFWTCYRVLRTWLIIFVGEMMFRADGFPQAILLIKHMFMADHTFMLTDGTLFYAGLDVCDIAICIAGVIVVAIVDWVKEKKGDVIGLLKTKHVVIRWSLYYALILAVIVFGAYGTGYQAVDLIYAGF